LNARHVAEEANIVAAAGQGGRVTVSTNMAGRGTDIKLGAGVPDIGGMHVILTELHESARIDRQLIGRCGRQGDPGTYRRFLALDDDILETGFGPKKAEKLKQAGRRRWGGGDGSGFKDQGAEKKELGARGTGAGAPSSPATSDRNGEASPESLATTGLPGSEGGYHENTAGRASSTTHLSTTNGSSSALSRFVRWFQKAQSRVERRHFRSRRLLLYHEKERKKVQAEMGQDPYLDTPG
jgi:hypothetical protein